MRLMQRKDRMKLAAFQFFIFMFCCLFFHSSKAQYATRSPYSAYGIGDVNNKSFGNSYAMGGSYIALQNDSTPMFFINNGNPASYSNVRLTTADLAINFNRTLLQTSAAKQTVNLGSVGHLALAFPVNKWWGTSVGLLPYSSVGYVVSSNQADTINVISSGTGGLNQVYFGNAIKPLYWIPGAFLRSKKYERLKQEKKDSIINKILKRKESFQALSLGANASYMFGNINYSQNSIFQSSAPSVFNINAGTTTRVSDFYFDYGMQYAYSIDSIKGRDLRDNVKIMVGATLATQTNLSARVDSLSYSYFDDNGLLVIQDTIINSSGSKGAITIPLSFGVGLGFKKGERWLIAADYAMQNWSKYKAFNQSPGFKNSTRISLGIQCIPDKEGNYLKRVNYRIGGRYAQTMIVINNYQITEQAVTFGVGLPVGTYRLLQNFSMINIGMELGMRGTTTNNLLKEQFFKVSLGFTLNDRWFVKPKYD
jgi:hypothetical protein